MSGMVERVATAIGCINDNCRNSQECKDCSTCLRAARAAIEAMREPTADMIIAAYHAVGIPERPVLANGYRAMVDAALK